MLKSLEPSVNLTFVLINIYGFGKRKQIRNKISHTTALWARLYIFISFKAINKIQMLIWYVCVKQSFDRSFYKNALPFRKQKNCHKSFTPNRFK